MVGGFWVRQRVGTGLTIVGCLTIAAALFLPWFSFSWYASPRDPRVLPNGIYSLRDILAHWSMPTPLFLPVACLLAPGALAVIGISLALLRARAGTRRDLLTLELIVLLCGLLLRFALRTQRAVFGARPEPAVLRRRPDLSSRAIRAGHRAAHAEPRAHPAPERAPAVNVFWCGCAQEPHKQRIRLALPVGDDGD